MSNNSGNSRKYSLFPKTLAQCVEPVTVPVFRSRGIANIKILTEWPEIVGKTLARYSSPERLSFPKGKTIEGTLTIAVASGFATELQHMQPVIMERINAYFGYKAVSRLSLTQNFIPQRAKPTPKIKEIPADQVQLPEPIDDPELEAALRSFAQRIPTA